MIPKSSARRGETCTYCHHGLQEQKWASEWDFAGEVHHYKHLSCTECGRKNWLRVSFQGSGHDDVFPKRRVQTIESILNQVREK